MDAADGRYAELITEIDRAFRPVRRVVLIERIDR
jgi:hypothetical protein